MLRAIGWAVLGVALCALGYPAVYSLADAVTARHGPVVGSLYVAGATLLVVVMVIVVIDLSELLVVHLRHAGARRRAGGRLVMHVVDRRDGKVLITTREGGQTRTATPEDIAAAVNRGMIVRTEKIKEGTRTRIVVDRQDDQRS